MKKKVWSLLLALPLLLVACGGGNNPEPTPGPGPEPDPQTDIDEQKLNEYMDGLKQTSQSGHFYYHYLRYAQTAADYNNWDAWVFPYRPKEGQGVRFDWNGRTSAADKMSATGDAKIDSFGYVTIDVDLFKTYDGGWDNVNRRMGGTEVNYLTKSGITQKNIVKVQLVLSATRATADSEFWANDGGDVEVKLLDYALTNADGSTSYHAFVYQDHVALEAGGPTPKPVVNAQTVDNPFADDDGTNVTYGKEEYNTASWQDKPLKASSPKFANLGVGYQVMVSSFADSDNDGFGDIYGIEQKLDYIYNLGVRALWLTPIQKSDSYHGYDISDYLVVDAKYGSSESPAAKAAGAVTEETAMKDYKSLLDKAHEKGMVVVMDLVLNHTSTNNTWFIKSAQLDKTMRGYYQWGNNHTQSETINERKFWYPYGDHVYSYYAKFGSFMPELNYAYAKTREAVETIALNWCEIGVDGFRMDAVKHIFMNDEVAKASNDIIVKDVSESGDYSSNLSKNLNFWRELNYVVKDKYPNAFFVGENFDGHAYHVAPYYEGFDSLFDFYSYFNLSTVAADVKKGSNKFWLATKLGAYPSTGDDIYNKAKDTNLEGANLNRIKEGGWTIREVLETNNKYRTGNDAAVNATTGYSSINGAFTSNHDIARAINRVAGTEFNNEGLTAQGNVTKDYDYYDELATVVEITELMLPGITWIYYGDELGMTGNFASGQNANSPYADLAYRQPMKWKQGGAVGDGSMTTGYGISGATASVEWDSMNASSTVKDVETQVASETSHYSAIKAFANAKSDSVTLAKGLMTVEAAGSGQYSALIKRQLGDETYVLAVNYGTSPVNINLSGTLIASYRGASMANLPARSAILVKCTSGQTSGFGLMINGKAVAATPTGTKDTQGREQYLISAQEFKTGDTFSLYDFAKQATWVIDIDPYSFGANGDASKVAAYVTKGATTYTVKKDFTADVYIKIKNNDDQIYFGLK